MTSYDYKDYYIKLNSSLPKIIKKKFGINLVRMKMQTIYPTIEELIKKNSNEIYVRQINHDNKNITFLFIKERVYRSVSYTSHHPCITIKDVLDNPDLPWNWMDLSSNTSITAKDMINNPKLPWDWDCWESKPDTTARLINGDYISYNSESGIYNTYRILQNPNITVAYFRKNKRYFDRDWRDISCHPNITMKDIENNPDLPWEYKSVFRNPNLTVEYIEKNLKKNNSKDKEEVIYNIKHNDFLLHDVVFKKQQKKYKNYINKLLINMTNLCYPVVKDIIDFI